MSIKCGRALCLSLGLDNHLNLDGDLRQGEGRVSEPTHTAKVEQNDSTTGIKKNGWSGHVPLSYTYGTIPRSLPSSVGLRVSSHRTV
eukprot:5116131-Prymnesium_polylepis.1